MQSIFILLVSVLIFTNRAQCGAIYREIREISSEKSGAATTLTLEEQPQVVSVDGDNYVPELRNDQIPVKVIEIDEPAAASLKSSEDQKFAEAGTILNEIIAEDALEEKKKTQFEEKQRIRENFENDKKIKKEKEVVEETAESEKKDQEVIPALPAAIADKDSSVATVVALDDPQANAKQAIPTIQPPVILVPQPTTPGLFQAIGQNLLESFQNTTNRLNSTIQGFQQQLLSALNPLNVGVQQSPSPSGTVDAAAASSERPSPPNPLQSVVNFFSGNNAGTPPNPPNPLQGILNIFNRPQAAPLTANPASAPIAAAAPAADTIAPISSTSGVASLVDDKIDPNHARTEEEQSIGQSDELIIVNDDVSKE